MAAAPLTSAHRLEVVVQLKGNNTAVKSFEIRATVDNGDQYAASGSMTDDWRVLQEVLDEIKRCYPTRAHFSLTANGRRLVPR